MGETTWVNLKSDTTGVGGGGGLGRNVLLPNNNIAVFSMAKKHISPYTELFSHTLYMDGYYTNSFKVGEKTNSRKKWVIKQQLNRPGILTNL